MSSTTEYLDQYCERLGSGLWAEPFNALTNLAFLAAAFWLLSHYRRRFPDASERRVSHYWLIGLVGVIGVGSGLFHTFATRWAEWMDVIPILVFQLSFLWLYLTQVARLNRWRSAAWMLVFLGSNVAVGWTGETLERMTNGSIMYLPAILAVGLLGMDYQRRVNDQNWLLLAAASLFCLSLTFRTLDDAVCEWWPVGTHFLWHLLNSLVLGLSSWSVIRQPQWRPADQEFV